MSAWHHGELVLDAITEETMTSVPALDPIGLARENAELRVTLGHLVEATKQVCNGLMCASFTTPQSPCLRCELIAAVRVAEKLLEKV